MDTNDLERERGITILAKCTERGLEGHAHQHRRYARPRRLRRRGRAHPQHGRRRRRAGRRLRRPAAADQVRGLQGVEARPAADRGHQQDRPPGRAPPRRAERGVRSVRQPRRHRRAARFPGALRLGPQRLDGARSRRVRKSIWRRCSISCSRTCRRRASRQARCACWRRRSKPIRSSAASSPAASRRASSSRTSSSRRSIATARWSRISACRRCWPSAASSACRSSRPRRARSSRLPGMSEATVADTLCDPSVETPIPAQPVDPPTLSMTFRINDGPFAGQEGDKVQSRVIRDRLHEGGGAQHRHQDHDLGGQGCFRRLRPRRASARDPDREHAPRRLRADRFAPEGRVQTDENGQRLEPIEEVIIDVDDGPHRRRRAEAVGAQRRAARNAPVGRRTDAHGVQCADARPARLPGGAVCRTRAARR